MESEEWEVIEIDPNDLDNVDLSGYEVMVVNETDKDSYQAINQEDMFKERNTYESKHFLKCC